MGKNRTPDLRHRGQAVGQDPGGIAAVFPGKHPMILKQKSPCHAGRSVHKRSVTCGGRDPARRAKKKPAATCFPGTDPVSSALRSLTSVFGMGTGMASAPWLPACIVHAFRPAPEAVAPAPAGFSLVQGKSPARGDGNMAKPRGLLVMLGCARRRACTCILSTWCSPRGLRTARGRRDVSSRGGLPA